MEFSGGSGTERTDGFVSFAESRRGTRRLQTIHL